MYDLKDTEGKIYVTAAGYVIPFLPYGFGQVEFCPLRNAAGQTAVENSKAKGIKNGCGWQWEKNGQIQFESKETADALEIVGEYKHPLDLPKGYRWKGGFPQLGEVGDSDHFLNLLNNSAYGPQNIDPLLDKDLGERRILLEKIEEKQITEWPPLPTSTQVRPLKAGWYITNSGYAVELDNNLHGKMDGVTHSWNDTELYNVASHADFRIVGECPEKLIPELPSGYRWVGDHPRFVNPEKGQTILSDTGRALKVENARSFTKYGAAEDRRILIEKITSEPKVVDSSLKVGKIYLTKGGWLVRVNSLGAISAYLDVRTSPGTTSSGLTAEKLGYSYNDGWVLASKIGSKPDDIDISDELEIVSEYTGYLNPEFPDPPKGYKWKHGFPKLTEKLNGEAYYNKLSMKVIKGHHASANHYKEWLCLVPAEPEKDILVSKEVETPTYSIDFAKYARWDIVKRSMDIFNSGFVKKEEEMKKETAVAASKAVGSFAWKAANYWLFEPATAWGKKAMSSVRHIVFAGLVFGSFCLWMNPQKTLDIAKSCLPKISVSVEAPEIVR